MSTQSCFAKRWGKPFTMACTVGRLAQHRRGREDGEKISGGERMSLSSYFSSYALCGCFSEGLEDTDDEARSPAEFRGPGFWREREVRKGSTGARRPEAARWRGASLSDDDEAGLEAPPATDRRARARVGAGPGGDSGSDSDGLEDVRAARPPARTAPRSPRVRALAPIAAPGGASPPRARGVARRESSRAARKPTAGSRRPERPRSSSSERGHRSAPLCLEDLRRSGRDLSRQRSVPNGDRGSTVSRDRRGFRAGCATSRARTSSRTTSSATSRPCGPSGAAPSARSTSASTCRRSASSR